jgi:hypothetical protein
MSTGNKQPQSSVRIGAGRGDIGKIEKRRLWDLVYFLEKL